MKWTNSSGDISQPFESGDFRMHCRVIDGIDTFLFTFLTVAGEWNPLFLSAFDSRASASAITCFVLILTRNSGVCNFIRDDWPATSLGRTAGRSDDRQTDVHPIGVRWPRSPCCSATCPSRPLYPGRLQRLNSSFSYTTFLVGPNGWRFTAQREHSLCRHIPALRDTCRWQSRPRW